MVVSNTMKKSKTMRNKNAKRGGMKNKTNKTSHTLGRAIKKMKTRSKKAKHSRKHRVKRKKPSVIYGGNNLKINNLYNNLKSIILRDEEFNDGNEWGSAISRVLREEDNTDIIKEAFMVRDKNGNNLVHLAASLPWPPLVPLESLIDIDRIVGGEWVKNNVIDARNNSGNTPLHAAVEGANPFAYDILIEYMADTGILNNAGKTPLQYAIETGVPNEFYFVLNDEGRFLINDIELLRANGIELHGPE